MRKLLYLTPLVLIAVVAATVVSSDRLKVGEPKEAVGSSASGTTIGHNPATAGQPANVAPGRFDPMPPGYNGGTRPLPRAFGSGTGDPRFNAMAAEYNQLLSQTLPKEEYAKFLKEFEGTVDLAQARAALIHARSELEQVAQKHKDTKAGQQAAELLKLLPDKTKLEIQDPFVTSPKERKPSEPTLAPKEPKLHPNPDPGTTPPSRVFDR